MGGAAGYHGFDSLFHLAAGQQHAPPAGQALQADVRAETHDAPLVSAAGVRLAEAEDKLAEFLDNPEVCPHGSPIPEKNIKRPASPGITMANLEVGQSARVLNIIVEHNPDFLRYLTGLNLTPGAAFKVLEKAPFDGTMSVEVNGESRAIGREAASMIIVRPQPGRRERPTG